MQKREKMVERISGVEREPVRVERWWRASRRSWAMKSPESPADRPWMTASREREVAWRDW